jgi:hypothetical protein
VETCGPDGVSFGGNFFLEGLSWGLLDFSRVSGVIEGRAGKVNLHSVSGVFLGGRARGSVAADLANEGSVTLEMTLKDGDAAEIPAMLHGSDMPLSGRIALRISAEFGGLAGPRPASVRGQGSLEWSDAVLGYLPVIGGLDRFVAFQRGIVFRSLRTDFNFGSEGILFRNGSAAGPLFDLELARPGAVRFDRKTDLEFLVKRGHREERKFPVFTKLTNTMKKMFVAPFEDMLTLGIRVSGDYLDPQFDLILPGKGR